MKKIINGRKYDTETAKEIGYWSNGEGGALTQYSRDTWDGRTGSSQIILMTENEAKEWSENKLSCDEYEALFGEVEE